MKGIVRPWMFGVPWCANCHVTEGSVEVFMKPAGTRMYGFVSGGPASSTHTLCPRSASRYASTQPAVPAPTMTKSKESIARLERSGLRSSSLSFVRLRHVIPADVAQTRLAVMTVGPLVAQRILGNHDLLHVGRAFSGEEHVGVRAQPGH